MDFADKTSAKFAAEGDGKLTALPSSPEDIYIIIPKKVTTNIEIKIK